MTANTDSRTDRLFSSQLGREICRLAEQAIEAHGMPPLLRRGTLIGFSGGPDSVALLLFLKHWRAAHGDFPIGAVHIHHGIRGAEADRDLAFSRRFCMEEEIPFFEARVDVPALAKSTGESMETAARNARYSCFDKIISGRNEFETVALAHNATDNLETVLFRILRGAGTHGAIGILPVRDRFVRPLLFVPKATILSALDAAEVPYMNDSTNQENDCARNYIRNEILPRLRPICTSPEESVRRFSQNLAEDDAFLCEAADRFLCGYPDGRIPYAALSALAPAVFARVLQRMHAALGVGGTTESVHVRAILAALPQGQPTRLSLPGDAEFVFDGEICYLHSRKEPPPAECALSSGENDLSAYGYLAYLSETGESHIFSSNVYNFSTQENLGSAIIHGVLRVRPKKEGDAYFYGGMTHRVKKLFASARLTDTMRRTVPVFYDDVGIVYVAGFGVRDDGNRANGPYLTLASLTEASDTLLSRRRKTAHPAANDRKV